MGATPLEVIPEADSQVAEIPEGASPMEEIPQGATPMEAIPVGSMAPSRLARAPSSEAMAAMEIPEGGIP